MNISVIGATGYVGAELMRLLDGHPEANVVHAVSKSYAGQKMSDIYPSFMARDAALEALDIPAICADSDIVFTCLPHGASADVVSQLFEHDVRVIDMSGDFRYRDAAVYEQWYDTTHPAKALLKQSVFGMPELYRSQIAGAKLVGNPGCYTTSAILALAPLLQQGVIETGGIIVDAKSGVSGAGRAAGQPLMFSEAEANFKAYGVATHRHTSEIEQEISLAAGSEIAISFTPHLLPIKRGILSTIYATPKADDKAIRKAYDGYAGEPFVQVMKSGLPEIKHVAGSNHCAIGFVYDERLNRLIIVSCIDNLLKGASGQAVQNMNIMCGFPETAGLNDIGWYL